MLISYIYSHTPLHINASGMHACMCPHTHVYSYTNILMYPFTRTLTDSYANLISD